MKILIFISSLTGNTKKVALHVAENLKTAGHDIIIEETHPFLKRQVSCRETELPSSDLILVCFWCRRGSMDDDSLHLLSLFKNQTIGVLGTMGGDPLRPYGERVRKNAVAAVSEKNKLAGVFVCQGKIQESRTEKRRNLPKDHIHYLDDESYARHLASRSHPDTADLAAAKNAVAAWIIERKSEFQ